MFAAWREVALDVPSLWTQLSLDGASGVASRHARQRGRYGWPYPSFLDDLLLRSRSLPVRLRVSMLDTARLLVLCDSVQRHMHRIRALRISIAGSSFITRDELPRAFQPPEDFQRGGLLGCQLLAKELSVPGPILEELWIHDQGHVSVPLNGNFFIPFPKLRSLSLAGWDAGREIVQSPVQSVTHLTMKRRIEQGPMPHLFRLFPGLRELVVTGVTRHLPLMRQEDTLHSLSIEPANDNWSFNATQNIAPERIAHITIEYPSPAVSREFLASLHSIEVVRLDHVDDDIAGLHLYASTAERAMSRTLNMLCLRVLGEVFEGWQATCFANVVAVAVSDKLPWASVLPFLSAMRSVRELTFLISPWTAKAIHRESNCDTTGGPHLLDSDPSSAEVVWPPLPSLRALRFIAVEPVRLDPQALLKDARPGKVTPGGRAAHRVSAVLVRTMLSCFDCRVNVLAFDGVVMQEGADAPVMRELRELVQSLVLTPPDNL